MTDRPILFSAPMVRALLDGRKTQTRRIAKFIEPSGEQFHIHNSGGGWFGPEQRVSEIAAGYAPYDVGDRLWVKETWRAGESWDEQKPSLIPAGAPVDYLVGPRENGPAGKTRVSIFMPRWASRLTLPVTDVRVERLQAITLGDICAEGLGASIYDFKPVQRGFDAWISLWDSINGAGAWEANPWVVVVTFDVRKGNIDG